MKKKLIAAVLTMSMAAAMLSGCGGSGSSADSTSKAPAANGDVVDVQFWSAPNENQFNYWTEKAKAFNAEGVEVNGKKVQVTVSMIPETTSSEAAIQNALATDSAPAISENINNSFMATLADSDCVYDIQDESWYQDIMKNKALDEGVSSQWEYNGKQYVIPVYINPICLIWNQKALDVMGIDVPKTMDDYKAMIQAFVDKKDELASIGVEFTSVQNNFLTSADYWNRNYDFMMIYDALGGGKLYEGNSLAIDPEIAAEAYEFWGMLGNTIGMDEVTNIWTSENCPEVFGFGYPWELNSYTEAGKVYGEDYVFGPTIVNKEGDDPAYYSDSKGIVLYKDSNITDDIHQGAVEFISWVYNAENAAQTDLDWLKATTMLPVRGDITSNDLFNSVLEETPALSFLADAIPYAVAGPTHASSSDMYIQMGEVGFAPYINEAVTTEPLNAPDASSYIADALEAMKSAGNLD